MGGGGGYLTRIGQATRGHIDQYFEPQVSLWCKDYSSWKSDQEILGSSPTSVK